MSNRRLDAAFIRVYREQARIEQKSRCKYCHERLTARTATADHVKPRSNHGLDRRDNIVAACEPCNKAKGSMSVAEFQKLLHSFPTGHSIPILLAWSRRRINLAVARAERRILAFVGRSPD
ncbi:HNH endonuclease [Agrobacterium rubi]|nr:HNH endonuclease [Agrobacterium rubi]NTF24319.1 HNH endonuclease [Agrobacterium rubi]